MSKIIITIVLTVIIIAGILLLTKQKNVADDIDTFDSERAKIIAKEWITGNASTYVFDGDNLELLETEEVEKRELYKLTFSFTSRAAGYGDRTDELVAQVITSHVIEVVVEKGKVVSAITDGNYDEIKNAFVEPETKIIIVYFAEVIDGQERMIEAIREIPFTVAVGRASIEELLKGPSAEEKAAGLSTSIPEGTELLSIDIQSGVARVDFSKELQKGVAGSARVTAIRNQIEKTLMQFNSVDEVIITVEGESEGILQP